MPGQAGGTAGRASVACPHFPACVGCPCVGTPYGEQLRAKQAGLRAALDVHPALASLAPEKIVGSPEPFGYRNGAKLVFRARRTPEGGREVLLGVYRPGTHSVLPAHLCSVHDPRLARLLAALRQAVEDLAIPIFDERRRQGVLRYALARVSRATGALHLTLVAAAAEVPHVGPLLDRLRRRERRLEAAFLCVNPTAGNTILSPDIRRFFGPPGLVEHFGRLHLESRPDAFVQANVEIATRIYATAEQWLEPSPDDVVLDLYGGVGGLGLAIAPRVARVLGVESSAAAVECANANARRAHARHVRYVVGSAEEAVAVAERDGWATAETVATIVAGAALGTAGDVAARERLPGSGPGPRRIVVVNPPRKGLGAAARAAVLALAPDSILYLSCDPATLARDLAALAARGFAVRRMRPFDMLPQTPHLEVLALLERVP